MALGKVNLLSSRRSYELPGDRLRLTMVTVAETIQAIRGTFGFQFAQVANPMPTFGTVPPTIPPGVVFNYGRIVGQPPTVTPIRYIHFEPQRIVIDVAGPSDAISPIYAGLREILTPVRMPDGTEVIGEPVAVLDYSEITIQPPLSLETLFAPRITALFRKQLRVRGTKRFQTVVPQLAVQPLESGATYGLEDPGETGILRLELRAGTRVDEQVWFSGAPLDSDGHVKYLESLVAMIAENATEK